MSDPFNPIPEVRKHQANYIVDAHGDTWDETGTVKIAFNNPAAILASQDATRAMIRRALDAEGIRDRAEPAFDSNGEFIGNLLPNAGIFQIGDFPTSERLAAIEARDKRNAQAAQHKHLRTTDRAYRRLDDLDVRFPEVAVTAKTLCTRGDTLGRDNLIYLMNKMYREGGELDTIYISLELAYDSKLISLREYTWRRTTRGLRGIWRRSANFGARFARLIRGTTRRTKGR